ncbi:MAG: ribosome assembly RNA-binding protein YhbY [Rhodocyclaceae bacterium]
MLELSPAQRRDLRAAAHHLQPVVSVASNGLTESVLKEIERSLKAHELIKIRVYGDDRALREEVLKTVCDTLSCAAVQHIGKLLVVFRPKPEEKKPAPKKTPARPAAGGKAVAKTTPRRPATGAAPKRPDYAPRKPGAPAPRGTRGAARTTTPGRPAPRKAAPKR